MAPSASTSTGHRPLASFNTPASMSTRAHHACLLQHTADDARSPVHLGSALQALDAHTRAGSEKACRGRDGGRGSTRSSCKCGLARRHWRRRRCNLRKPCEHLVDRFVAAGAGLQLQQQRHCTHRHRPASIIGKAGEAVEGTGSCKCHRNVVRGQQNAHAIDGTHSPSSRLVVCVIDHKASKSTDRFVLKVIVT